MNNVPKAVNLYELRKTAEIIKAKVQYAPPDMTEICINIPRDFDVLKFTYEDRMDDEALHTHIERVPLYLIYDTSTDSNKCVGYSQTTHTFYISHTTKYYKKEFARTMSVLNKLEEEE